MGLPEGNTGTAGRKAEQGKPCGYSCRQERQDSQALVVCGISCSRNEVGEEEREDAQKYSVSSAWTKVTHYFTLWLSYMNAKI